MIEKVATVYWLSFYSYLVFFIVGIIILCVIWIKGKRRR